MLRYLPVGAPQAGLFLGLILAASPALDWANELGNYVAQTDPSFSWKQLEQQPPGAVRLQLTSQTWRGNRWEHEMLVVRPTEVRQPDIALLLISGDGDVGKHLDWLKRVAERGGAMAAVLNRVPNQPLYDGRKEDALIAFTFEQYMKTGDSSWPLLFPMVKSAVAAMDALQAHAQQAYGQSIKRFVVTGASKRGWTTWLVGAVDPRVKAIAPMVIDMLNMKAQAQWAAQMYGRQSEEIQDYTDYNFTERLDEPRMVQLRGWVDPFSYRRHYKLPKLLLLGTNDPYWVVDSLRNYWNELPEPKLVFQTPNAGHDLAGGEQATETLAEFFRMIAAREPLPKMHWAFTHPSPDAAGVAVKLNEPAKEFRLWTATSTNRDFRAASWSSTMLPHASPKEVSARIERPAQGFRAFLVEAELQDENGRSYRLSTEARVVPDGPPAVTR